VQGARRISRLGTLLKRGNKGISNHVGYIRKVHSSANHGTCRALEDFLRGLPGIKISQGGKKGVKEDKIYTKEG